MLKFTKSVTCGLLALATCTSFSSAGFTQGMSEHWDVNARHKSQALHSHGMTLMTKRQIDAAIKDFRQATIQDPTDSAAWSALGMALAMQSNNQEALDSLQKSFTLRQSQETLLSTGIVYYLSHDYDAALNSWNRVLEANPKGCHILGDLGWGLIRKGDVDQAMSYFDRLTKCSPNSQFGFHGLAFSKYLKGDFAGARQAAERAEAIESYPPVVLLLAKLDFLQGDRSRGQRRAQQYSALSRKFQQRSMTAIGYPLQHDFRWDPFLADNLDNSSLLLARVQDLPKDASRQRSLSNQGKAAAVISSAKERLGANPKDYYLTRELGLAQLAAGDYSSAADSFKTVLELSPKSYVDLLHLGRALSLDGKQTEASAAVRQFQQHWPNQQLSPAFSQIANVDPALHVEEVYRKEHHRTYRPAEQTKAVPSTEF